MTEFATCAAQAFEACNRADAERTRDARMAAATACRAAATAATFAGREGSREAFEVMMREQGTR